MAISAINKFNNKELIPIFFYRGVKLMIVLKKTIYFSMF